MVRASFFSQIRHRNALTEIAWEDAVQGLGHNVYRSVIEKQGIVAGIVACCKSSDSGERCEVKKAMKSRGGLGIAFIFSRSFLLRTAPHYLNAWNRLQGLLFIGNVFYKQWHLWVLFH